MDVKAETPLTILIVDDEPANIRILAELLKSEYNLRSATSGEKALSIALSDEPPDLILMDIIMPGLDGYDVCRQLKNDPIACKIPLIFITSKDSEQDEITGFQVGAVDYITKPFRPVVVQARIRTHAELKSLRDMLEKESLIDRLTGIANRRKYEESLSTIWEFATNNGSQLSLIMIDLDDFKKLNDHYGHLVGDECLRRVAKALQAIPQRKKDLFARYGGEEFCCLLPDTDLETALTIAEQLRHTVLNLNIPHGYCSTGPVVSISLGVATIPACGGYNSIDLVRAADEALYLAKQSGRNQICHSSLPIIDCD